ASSMLGGNRIGPAPAATADGEDAQLVEPGSLLAGPRNVQPHIAKRGEQYMCKEETQHYRNILNSWKRHLLVEVARTGTHRNAANGASASTATATTAIARAPRAARADYVGRFAPSPTGSLHLGSLVAAVGSFADARSRGGRWLLRMEDLDASRVIPGCAERMLRMLEAFGLTWDGVVEYQSARTHHYGEALATLEALGL